MTTNFYASEPAFPQPQQQLTPAKRAAAGDLRQLLLTLAWEQIWLSKWPKLFGLVVSLLFMLIFLALTPIISGGWRQAEEVRLGLEVSLLPSVMLLLLLGTGAGHWPASRLYTKPLSSALIAGWQTWSGVILLSIETPLVISCYNYFFAAGWPTGSATLFTVTLWVVSQPFFLVGTRSFGQLIATSLPITAMCIWFMASYGVLVGERRDWLGLSLVEVLAMLVVLVVFPFITQRVIAADRCGESVRSTDLSWLFDPSSWIGKGKGRLPINRPFRSPFAAHLWYQWRWKGYGLLYSMLWLSVVGGIAIAWNCQGRGTWGDVLMELTTLTSVGFVFVCSIYGFVLGANLDQWITGRSRREKAQRGRSDAIGSFIGSRPISDQSLARVLLLVCAGAVALAAVPWLLICNASWYLSASEDKLWNATLLLAVGFWWMAASNVMTLVCTGRALRGLMLILVVVVLPMFGVLQSQWIVGPAAAVVIQNLYWLSMFGLIIVLTIACTATSVRKRFVGARTLASIVGFLTAATTFTAWYARMSPEGWMWLYSAAALVSVLPIVAMPLAIEMNRHR